MASIHKKHRRNILKSLAATSAVAAPFISAPKQWHKPLIHGLILPSHAQTSPTPKPKPKPKPDGPPALTQVSVTGVCDITAPDDQFHLIEFSPFSPATAASTITITDLGSTDPGSPTGANLVVYASHQTLAGYVYIVVRNANGITGPTIRNGCAGPADFTLDNDVSLLGGGQLEFFIDLGGVVDAPTITYRDFTIF